MGAFDPGKTNMDEFAMAHPAKLLVRAVKNPWDLDTVPGGSSGGVGSGNCRASCTGATGTGHRWSIRQPRPSLASAASAHNGVVSRYGMVAFASSLDRADRWRGRRRYRPATERDGGLRPARFY